MSTIALTVSEEYLLVLFGLTMCGLQCLLISFCSAGSQRSFFTQEFMQKHFGEDHKKATQSNISRGGYPDMGSGLYAQKLSYKQWLEFNNGQRAHLNYVEVIASFLIISLASGLFNPITTFYSVLLFFASRILYAFGYCTSKGAYSVIRRTGAGLTDLAILVNFIIACRGFYSHISLSSLI